MSQTVYVATHPKTYVKDIKYHTDKNCGMFMKADFRYRKMIPLEEAVSRYRLCKNCEARYEKTRRT